MTDTRLRILERALERHADDEAALRLASRAIWLVEHGPAVADIMDKRTEARLAQDNLAEPAAEAAGDERAESATLRQRMRSVSGRAMLHAWAERETGVTANDDRLEITLTGVPFLRDGRLVRVSRRTILDDRTPPATAQQPARRHFQIPDLGDAQRAVLRELRNVGDLGLSRDQVAQRVGRPASQVSDVFGALEQKGLARRVGRYRSMRAYITELGVDVQQALVERAQARQTGEQGDVQATKCPPKYADGSVPMHGLGVD